MINTKSFIVLKNFREDECISSPLCIFSTNFLNSNVSTIKKIVDRNPKTEFWLATDDSSRSVIELANKIGISRTIPQPINESLVNNYLNDSIPATDYKPFVCNIDLSTRHVAVVDDCEINLYLLSDVLKDMTVNVHSFSYPEKLISTLEETKYDLFLLDILMPNLSGLELANIIKNSKLNAMTPIVFVSAVSDIKSKLHGLDLGAYSYIEKPYNIEVVKRQIYNVLAKQIQTEAINRQKENFVAMLTHDLKSPINAEIKALELLVNNRFGEITETQHEIISTLLNSAKYMKHITDQILSFYKCNNGYITLKKEETVFSDIVSDCVCSMNFLISEKNQKIHVKDYTSGIKTSIDTLEIKRVIRNLISNASEYSPESSKIDIELFSDNSSVTFSITDYGYGIKGEDLNNIFDEYITLAKQQKKVGFGLGLNICKKVIDAHGGTINLESEVGRGTKIDFTIPLK